MDRPSSGGLSLGEIAELVDGQLAGDRERRITGAHELAAAGSSEIAYCGDPGYLEALRSTSAGAVLVSADLELGDARPGDEVALLVVDNARLAFAITLEHLYARAPAPPGVHPSAVVAADAVLGDGVSVGPHAVLDSGCRIGARSEIGAGCAIGPGVLVGEDCRLGPRATLYAGTKLGARVVVHAGAVIGADGFGFEIHEATQVKIPQVGGVRIEDDVEVGANACVDRGTLGDTRIGAGTKIDNLVQIGHNCDVGEGCALSGLTGLSGSTTLGDGVIAGGNVGTAGHLTIGAGAMIAAKSGVHADVPPGAIVCGTPAIEMSLFRRVAAAWNKLPDLVRRVRRLERRLDDAES